MAVKRKGILAVPGTYNFGDRHEVKTAEELKLAAERQPIIPLTLGHPTDGIVRASDFIGTVSQKWNEKKRRVDADFWFYDEIPDDVRNKIINEWPTPISAGYHIESLDDGVQKGIFYTHIAVLKDSDDPKCPLGTCGVNVRMESNLTDTSYRYEQATDPDIPADKAEVAKTEPYDAVGLALMVGELKAEVAQLRQQLRERETPAPVKEEEPEQQETVILEEVTTPTPPQPKTTIPYGKSKEDEGPDEDGFFTIHT